MEKSDSERKKLRKEIKGMREESAAEQNDEYGDKTREDMYHTDNEEVEPGQVGR